MSGSPKYSATELERRRQQELEEKRRQEAAAEAQRRKEAAERERQRQLEQGRNQLQQQLQSFQQQLTAAQTLLHPGDFKTLSQDSQTCLQQISHAADQQALKQLTRQANQFPQRLETAKVQKRRDDAEKQRLAELDQQRFELGELEQQQQQLDAAIVQKFDPTGAQQVQQALDKVRQAIGTGKPQQVKAPLKQATQALQTHQQTVATALAQWQQAQSTAQDQLQELQTLLAGLQADPIIQRWQTPAQTQIQNLVHQAQTAIDGEQFTTVATLLSQAQTQAEEAIAAANQAQLKADQRDYITDSIAATLESMGFTVLHRQPEHPNHPASATILGAASHAGKGISVSVPVEGEVYYDVEGYAKQNVQAMGGGNAAACDEAEQVIEEMHHILESEFGVQMGELMWDGKDPNRQLRKADDLPQSGARHNRTQRA
jgi:sulfur carrier protein ThiS